MWSANLSFILDLYWSIFGIDIVQLLPVIVTVTLLSAYILTYAYAHTLHEVQKK